MIIRANNEITIARKNAFELISKSINLGLSRDPLHASLMQFLDLNPSDKAVYELLCERVENEERIQLYNNDPFRATNPILPNCFQGNIALGYILPKFIPWVVDPLILTNGFLACGRTGGGKTNLFLLVLSQILSQNLCNVKIFDRKLDYACLSIFQNFHYWSFKDYFVNWLEPPPGLSYRKWLSILFEIFANYLDVRIAGRNLLIDASLWLGNQRNSEQSGIYPTLIDVRNVIKSKKYPFQSHLARYQETIINRLTGLIDIYGDHICSNRKLDWDKYINSSWAISLDGLPTDMQNLMIAVTLGKILSHKMATNKRI